MIDKSLVLQALHDALTRDLQSVTISQKRIQEGATHSESRAESDKDTRATEASYVARGLAKRVSELQEAVSLLAAVKLRAFTNQDRVALTAIVTLEDDAEKQERYFVMPTGGGLRLDIHNQTIGVITPQSPLGVAVLGKHIGDELTLRLPGGTRDMTIVDIL